MAIAGKVAITLSTENGGAWSADVTYDRLVAVKHNNNLYISRKTVTNIEPPNDEFWFLALEGFSGEDIEDIINGTTQVGNAKTLDGHGAEYFAKDADLANYLPLTGGRIEGFLEFLHGNAQLMGDANHVFLASRQVVDDNNNRRGITIYNSNIRENVNGAATLFDVINGVTSEYSLLHTGNKPTGTYTGNGDATERRIATNGLGTALLITKAGAGAILTPMGGFLLDENGNTSTIKASEARFYYGTIILATTHSFLNTSGVVYDYQVL